MAWSMKKIALVAGGTVAGGTVCFLTAGLAAPVVGAFVGTTFMGLSGAAATSAGLAALGGGALAAGGGGMAAGAALVTTALTGAGAVLGSLGMGTMANFFEDSTQAFERALTQKDLAKAQQIIMQQEAKLQELQAQLDTERQRRRADEAKIHKLESAYASLAQVVQTHKLKLARAA